MTMDEIKALIDSANWQIDVCERPSVSNCVLLIEAIETLLAREREVLAIIRKLPELSPAPRNDVVIANALTQIHIILDPKESER